MRYAFPALLLAASLNCAAFALAQTVQPKIVDAQVSTQAASKDLHATLNSLAQAPAPLWVGYTIPTDRPYHGGNYNSGVTYLERNHSYSESSDSKDSSSTDEAAILYRLEGGKVTELRSAGKEDTLDAGGLRVVWLTGVTPEESISALKGFALEQQTGKVAKNAAFLISLHRSAAAVPAIVALAAPANDLALRDSAAFWLANQRGHDGFLAIQTFAHNDADAKFREKLTFDLTLSKDPGALPELVRMAHDDATPKVRQQAQFWMAQRGGKVVAADLRDDAEHDPDAGVRKQAVFAISRLPQEEATAKLCDLVSTSKDPGVRKQAVFWLGQSKDPKALDYLSKLVTAPSR